MMMEMVIGGSVAVNDVHLYVMVYFLCSTVDTFGDRNILDSDGQLYAAVTVLQ